MGDICDGCVKMIDELKALEDKEDTRHEEYLRKVGEYEADKAEMISKLNAIATNSKDNGDKISTLSEALIGHMKDEMKVHEKIFESITESKRDRFWIMAIGSSLILVFSWFYTTQYLPDQKYIQDTMMTIVKEGNQWK